MERKLILYALPLFALFIALEFAWSFFRGDGRYRLNDAISSLAVGLVGTSSGLLTAGFGTVFYDFFYRHFSVFHFNENNLATFIAANVVYDFSYYWFHRAHHRVNILWASHAAHHQSEDFNFSTAGRQSAFVFLTAWIFYLPMAALGFSTSMYLTVAAISVIYGFFTHTQYIPPLGRFESVFVGASNHRVHHGQNPIYIDKNYGSILSIWDRLFGTYQAEDPEHPLVYGITRPLGSWNPLWANLHVYASLLKDARQTRLLRDRFRIWFMPTGWRPKDVAEAQPYPPSQILNFKKFNPEIPNRALLYAMFQFGISTLGLAWLMKSAKSMDGALVSLSCLILWAGLSAVGSITDGKPRAILFEKRRLLLLSGLFVALIAKATLSADGSSRLVALGVMGLLYTLISYFWFYFICEKSFNVELAS